MPDAAIVIVTRNRVDLVSRTIESALALEGNLEIAVIDDGSTDGTAEKLLERFATIHVHRSAERRGYIVQRNRAAELVSSPIIFSIDDDAIFTSPHTVRDALRLFEEARTGVVSLAFVNRIDNVDSIMQAVAPDAEQAWVTNTFIGTAYALRRDIFQSLGGFREAFFHWGEEVDYSQRLLGAGYVVRVAKTDPIVHMPWAGVRDSSVMTLIARNMLLTLWLNAPFAMLLVLTPLTIARNLLTATRKRKDVGTTFVGCVRGLKAFWDFRHERRPLPFSIYRLWLFLRKHRPAKLEEIGKHLPPLRAVSSIACDVRR